jgi:hypothetical protein
MTKIIKAAQVAIFLALLLLSLAPAAFAQARGAGIARAAGLVPVRAASIRVPQAAVIRAPQLVGTPLHPNFAPISRVPGLPFNIQSLAATGRRDFDRRPRRGQAIRPFLLYSPFYSPYADYSYDVSQPPYVGEQPQVTAPAPPLAPSEPSPASVEPQPPPREVGQFILVRLDGQVVFAVAFTSVDGRLTYVTREGLRRSFPVTELDKQATLQMNDANGTLVSLPN